MTNSPELIESLINNGGKRSVTRAVFPPNASALLHYHTQYRETFSIQSGELTVFHGDLEHRIGVGQSYTIPEREIHGYQNVSGMEVTVDLILEPGHPGCEQTNEIVAGLEKDKKLYLFTSFGGYNLLWTAIYDLTNTIPTGMPGIIFSSLRFLYGKRKIQRVQQTLINKYVGRKIISNANPSDT